MRAPTAPSVVILCGGRGTRLREHTQSIPKPLGFGGDAIEDLRALLAHHAGTARSPR